MFTLKVNKDRYVKYIDMNLKKKKVCTINTKNIYFLFGWLYNCCVAVNCVKYKDIF
nr:hypothetical protein CPBEC2_18290 [Clostridium perfringens]BDA32547.1 hypothetical protein CPBEC4_26470 [Clostridium perfringens]